MSLILAIDQGTTYTTALLINLKAEILSSHSVKIPQYFPKESYVEHKAEDIKFSVVTAVNEVFKKSSLNKNDVVGIGISNQRETTCLFDRKGEALRPFIVWQCRRSEAICQRLKDNNKEEFLHKKTGLYLDPYFSASKLSFVFEEDKKLLNLAKNGEALFGTVDSFLSYWFLGGKDHITDASNASRTMLMDLKNLRWDEEALEIFQIPKNCLPKIVKSIGPYGKTKGLSFLPDGIPITAMLGDQQASLVGQACFKEGDAKATFGTGCFILKNIGKNIIYSKHGLLTSVAYQIEEQATYCLEGSAFSAGAAILFLKDNLGLINNEKEIESLAKEVSDSEQLVFIPAFTGLGAPYWKPSARAALLGLSRRTSKAHIARAVLEGIAIQNNDIISAMEKDSLSIKSLKVDGGASQNDLLMQIQADILGIPCLRDKVIEKTAQGVAYMSLLALKEITSINDIKNQKKPEHIFTPKMTKEERYKLINRYEMAVKSLYA